MPKSSEDYWREREEEQRKHNIKDEQEFRKELEKMYRATLKEVNDQIYAFYAKYASQNAITMAEAKRRADKLDIEAYAEKAKRYVKEKNFSEQANKEMRIYNLTMKANRLELLKAEIGLELCANADEVDDFMREELEGRTLNEIERQAGVLGKSVQNNRKFALSLVNASFHNATFSDRIWANQALLRNELSNILTTALIQGRNPRYFISQVRKRFDVSTNNAYRLLVTELARVQTSAQMESFKRNGFDQYTFLALGTACEICRKIDGKHFDVDKANAGINMPPMHPNCRCSTSAYMDDDEYNAWLDSYKNHGVTWDEWKKRYLEQKETTFVSKKDYSGDDMSVQRSVNRSLVNTKKYHDKFENIPIGKKARESIYQTAMKILEHRDGTDYEDIAAINLKTGEVLAFNTSSTRPGISGFTEKEYRKITESKSNIVIVHNHPNNSRLSYKDLQTLFQYDYVRMEIAICHNGDIAFAYDPVRNFDIEAFYQKAYNTYKEVYGKKQSELFATDKLYDSDTFKYERR